MNVLAGRKGKQPLTERSLAWLLEKFIRFFHISVKKIDFHLKLQYYCSWWWKYD